jgi:putative ABC transport system substrate-binding protein
MNSRRKSLIALGATVSLPRFVLAQAKKPPVVIGWLLFGSRELGMQSIIEFREGLSALGWKEGAQFVIEERWADGRIDRLPSLAQDLAGRKPAVVVAAPSQSVAAVAKAAPDTPIVHATGSDPVAAGFAKSLSRPGGMITGLTNVVTDVQQKFVELLIAAAPNVKRIGFLIDATTFSRPRLIEIAQRASAHFGIEPRFAEVAKAEDLDTSIGQLARESTQALAVMSSPLFSFERKRIAKLALAQRWPMIAGNRNYVADGALLSYGAVSRGNYRRVAYYVDRILKGAKPGDLPIEQPTTFELGVNLGTARMLGLKMPPEIMVRADYVIE